MDLPEKRGSTKQAGVLTIEIRADEEYVISAKAPERSLWQRTVLWWEVNSSNSDDAAEALTSQAPDA
jgi:hypothetical protein